MSMDIEVWTQKCDVKVTQSQSHYSKCCSERNFCKENHQTLIVAYCSFLGTRSEHRSLKSSVEKSVKTS